LDAPRDHRPPERSHDPDEIERIAHVGSWTLDPATGEATWSTEMYRILGLDPAGPAIALADISRLFSPDSVERVTAAVQRAVSTGAPWQVDLEIPRGDETRWVVSNGIAEVDDRGAVVRIRGTMQDVTELRRLEAQLNQAQRLEAIGQFAGGIAHDFNNILTAIRGYTELVLSDLDPGDRRAEDLGQVLAAADRAGDLIGQLLAFSRRQLLQPQVIDPGAVVADILPMLRRLLGEDVELVAMPEPGLGRITVDPGQLGQVLMNLAVNARDAMPRGGKLTIEAHNIELDATYASTRAEVEAGSFVVIEVTDTGLGMDGETRARAFEPFFTTKAPDRGTGMGLATVHGIVKQSGGTIYLYSEVGRGTTFKLYFPRTAAAVAEPAATDGRTPGGHAGTETILLVEDDADVRVYARRVLETAGYAVLEAADGAEAMDLAAARNGAIDLLLTDAVLPGMQGGELAERLTKARPGLPVLYVSGFARHAMARDGGLAASARFLSKPFRADELLRSTREALDA
jgi:signal transduction histidine kinase